MPTDLGAPSPSLCGQIRFWGGVITSGRPGVGAEDWVLEPSRKSKMRGGRIQGQGAEDPGPLTSRKLSGGKDESSCTGGSAKNLAGERDSGNCGVEIARTPRRARLSPSSFNPLTIRSLCVATLGSDRIDEISAGVTSPRNVLIQVGHGSALRGVRGPCGLCSEDELSAGVRISVSNVTQDTHHNSKTVIRCCHPPSRPWHDCPCERGYGQ